MKLSYFAEQVIQQVRDLDDAGTHTEDQIVEAIGRSLSEIISQAAAKQIEEDP